MGEANRQPLVVAAKDGESDPSKVDLLGLARQQHNHVSTLINVCKGHCCEDTVLVLSQLNALNNLIIKHLERQQV